MLDDLPDLLSGKLIVETEGFASMLHRLGDVIYWTASGAAVLCVFIGVLIAVTDHLHPSPSDWIAPVVACSVLASLIWLAGKAARYVLARYENAVGN